MTERQTKVNYTQCSGPPLTTLKVLNFSTRWNCWFLNICFFIRGSHAHALSDGALEINVGVVSSVDAASDHIAKYGTNHTEAIITESQATAEPFMALSDCAAVMVNTSTRFTDGEQMGFGAEIGISNQKLHARGPMGLEAMTTTTWIVTGNGQIRN